MSAVKEYGAHALPHVHTNDSAFDAPETGVVWQGLVVACVLQDRVEEEGQQAESLSAATCRGFYTSDVTLSPHDKG
jgi:hypothetical protein